MTGRPSPDGPDSGAGSLEEICAFLKEALPASWMRPEQVRPLEGDASDRRYYRIFFQSSGPARPSSLVLMKLSAPWSPSAGREELPFVNIARHLAEKGLPVPAILLDASREGFLLLEDAGDTTMQAYLGSCTAADRKGVYKAAVELIVDLQRRASEPSSRPCYAHGYGFDVPTFLQELRFFLEHAVGGLWKRKIPERDRQELEGYFEQICRQSLESGEVFTHRDYHSRNLMVRPDRIVMLDFQDARMGPCTYDLASLVLDSYVTLEPKEQEGLVDLYLDACRRAGMDRGSPESFRRAFVLTGLQRNLKAIGTFAFQAQVRGVERYLPFVPGTVRSVRRALERLPEYERLRRLLEVYVEGLG